MIARFSIYLPHDLFVTEEAERPTIDLISGEYNVRVWGPMLYAPPPDPHAALLDHWQALPMKPTFTGNRLVNDKKVAPVNVLVLDFRKPEFDRTRDLSTPESQRAAMANTDPNPELAFSIANEYLNRLRVYSRAFQIKPVGLGQDPWRLRYLTDDGKELPEEPGKIRGRQISGMVAVGSAAITPDVTRVTAARWSGPEPYAWDLLLLDARALLPDVGSSIVMAAAALETFIGWALNILKDTKPLPSGLWEWINNRDHWTKDPSVSDQLTVLLRIFTGHSLKDDHPSLWQLHKELRQARNALAHEGIAAVGSKPVNSHQAAEMVRASEQIVAWIESLLPETNRRARTEAVGPFSSKLWNPPGTTDLGIPLRTILEAPPAEHKDPPASPPDPPREAGN